MNLNEVELKMLIEDEEEIVKSNHLYHKKYKYIDPVAEEEFITRIAVRNRLINKLKEELLKS